VSLWESVLVALEGIVSNRLRSALTMLGVIFGVGAVIAAVSMTQGAKAATLEQFKRFGTNTLRVVPGQMRRGPVGGGMGSEQTLTYADAVAIAKECPSVVAVAPEMNTMAQVKAGSANTNTRVVGTTELFPQVQNYTLADGTFLTERDVKSRRKVAVLGPTVVENLFGAGESAVGKKVKISGMTFSVIGQFRAKGESGMFSPDDQIVVPLTTAMRRLMGPRAGPAGPRDAVNSISVQFHGDTKDAGQATAEVEALLRNRHHLAAEKENDFSIMSAAEMIEGAEESSRVLTLLFGSIAAVSLLVGGIGIMNIMLVSVTERTREIGLRKAIGATPRDIMRQFLIEALTLSVVGGGVGVAAGVGLALFLRAVGMNTAVSLPWVVVAFSFAALVGIVFGLLPSRKAASLDPIEALHYE
jgi:putative ABC transport system permease protein